MEERRQEKWYSQPFNFYNIQINIFIYRWNHMELHWITVNKKFPDVTVWIIVKNIDDSSHWYYDDCCLIYLAFVEVNTFIYVKSFNLLIAKIFNLFIKNSLDLLIFRSEKLWPLFRSLSLMSRSIDTQKIGTIVKY